VKRIASDDVRLRQQVHSRANLADARRYARTAAVIATACALTGCSLLTSFDGVAIGGGEDAGREDATGLDDAGPLADGGEGGALPGVDAAICYVHGTYCGGDKNGLPAGNLYRCTPDGRGFTLALTCAKGCDTRPGRDDVCVCDLGGAYCGGDQVLGEAGTLYTCGPNYDPVVKAICANGCLTNKGADDACQ
jgi:hypothetical protein